MKGPSMANFLRGFVYAVIKSGLGLLCRVHVEGRERIPAHGPLILYSNHTGSVEVPMLYALLYPRKATGWAKIESWDSPFLRWLFTLWEIIPVRRGELDMVALRKAVAALEQGYIFGLAPEGTRSPTGRLVRARPGAVLLASLSGAPLLPIAHWGGEDFSRNLKSLRRTDFNMSVGEPFRIDSGGRVTAEMRQQIVDEMMARLAALLPLEYRGEYGEMRVEEEHLRPVTLEGIDQASKP